MVTFLFEHKLLVITCAYIAIGIIVFWFVGEIDRIDDEKASLTFRGARFSNKRFAVYKCSVAIAAVILWPFLLQDRRAKARQLKPEDCSLAASKERQPVRNNSEDWRPRQTLLDDFVVEGELGEGGMGKVYLVKSRTTNMRFAVKRAKRLGEVERRNFLAELQTWIGLPEHANLVPCRFFRTVQDEVLIFAEYVEGGSLKSWIDSGKLYEGGAQKALERLLDTAIQFAWGLHCVHELGLVHQDVKPGNLLIAPECTAKVTDFGLSRARSRNGNAQLHYRPSVQNRVVSFGGMTQAYCSPEQAVRQPLSLKTDIWSWGVSVLDMFYGGVSCRYGQAAGESLKAYFEQAAIDENLPRMPIAIAKVLGKCFQPNPEHRWDNLKEAMDALIRLYQDTFSQAYPRLLTLPYHTKRSGPGIHHRRTSARIEWRDPRDWLQRAFQAEGFNRADAAKIMARQASSHRGQLVADVAKYR